MTLDNLPPVSARPMQIIRHSRWPGVATAIFAAVAIVLAGAMLYASQGIRPVDEQSNQTYRFVIHDGETAGEISESLQKAGLIRSAPVFQLYTKLTGANTRLVAGGYILKKSQSLPQIVDHLSAGKTDEINVTILPGLTLKELSDPQVKGSLAQQGYSQAEIQEAFRQKYVSPLLTDKKPGSSLEGYIYPETYRLMANNSLDQAVRMSLKELYTEISSRNLEEALKKQNLTLHQGIILASIVQKEVNDPADQRQVAQVFLKRLRENIVLGSDVTFIYAAKQDGRSPSVNDDSPYNTRKHAGLPPGPIANFTIGALEAVAHPSDGDYLYFVAGDDGRTYFAKTENEHLENVAKYCSTLCH